MANDSGKNVVVAQQLEALAIAAKNYTLAETIANQGQIMTALNTIEGKIDSLGGGSSTTALTTPTLSLGSWSKADTTYTASLSYSGDGNLSTNIGSISGTTLTITDEDGIFSGIVTATAGTSFAATTLNFSYNTETDGGGSNTPQTICLPVGDNNYNTVTGSVVVTKYTYEQRNLLSAEDKAVFEQGYAYAMEQVDETRQLAEICWLEGNFPTGTDKVVFYSFAPCDNADVFCEDGQSPVITIWDDNNQNAVAELTAFGFLSIICDTE